MRALLFFRFLLATLACLAASAAGAQVAGNAGTYQGGRQAGQLPAPRRLELSDSTFLITAKVMMHVPASGYQAVWALHADAASPEACQRSMQERIDQFTQALQRQFGVSEWYVDLIAQGPTYDYKVSGNLAVQELTGYTLSKNLIYSFQRLEDLDAVCALASSMGIYDLVKVDYLVARQEQYYAQLFEAAGEVLREKAARQAKLLGRPEASLLYVYEEAFYIVAPIERYREYQAYESGQVSSIGRSRDYIRKDIRKTSTFYYDRVDGHAFDRLLNAPPVQVGPQAVLELAVKCRLR